MASALPVDRAQSNAMNLQVLKRQDANVSEIVDSMSHVVVYEFDMTSQGWKRKNVEGSMFIVKRTTAPHYQIFVNNRLSTTNMVLSVDEQLELDSVDTFLILRCPVPASPNGFAIYGIWFFPEEDREKTHQLLGKIIASLHDPSITIPSAAVSAPATPPVPSPKAKKPSQQTQQSQQSQQQTPGRTRSRPRKNKENKTNPKEKKGISAENPPTILKRPSNNATSSPAPSDSTPQGMVPVSREDGIAAGEAILGMISHKRSSQGSGGSGQSSGLLVPTSVSPKSNGQVDKAELKQTLLGLLEDDAFFDQIYQAYVQRLGR